MSYFKLMRLAIVLLCCVKLVISVELTFELLDNAKDCFFEVIKKNTTTTLEFQVIDKMYETLISPTIFKCT